MKAITRMTLKSIVTNEWVNVELMEDGSMVWRTAQIRRVDENHVAFDTLIFPDEDLLDRPGSD